MDAKERAREACKKYYHSHREKRLEKVKEWYQKHKSEVLARKRATYVKHPRKMRERSIGWYWRNKDKVRAYRHSEHYREISRKWYSRQPAQMKLKQLLYTHGMTLGQYDELLKSQNGVCAICGNGNEHQTGLGRKSVRLTVDHCHASGRIRGLLCHKCNAGLGFFKDNPEILNKALDYLRS